MLDINGYDRRSHMKEIFIKDLESSGLSKEWISSSFAKLAWLGTYEDDLNLFIDISRKVNLANTLTNLYPDLNIEVGTLICDFSIDSYGRMFDPETHNLTGFIARVRQSDNTLNRYDIVYSPASVQNRISVFSESNKKRIPLDNGGIGLVGALAVAVHLSDSLLDPTGEDPQFLSLQDYIANLPSQIVISS